MLCAILQARFHAESIIASQVIIACKKVKLHEFNFFIKLPNVNIL